MAIADCAELAKSTEKVPGVVVADAGSFAPIRRRFASLNHRRDVTQHRRVWPPISPGRCPGPHGFLPGQADDRSPFQFGIDEGKRRVASFSCRCDYSQQRPERAEELPEWLSPFITRIEAFAQPGASAVCQGTHTEYEKGVGISWRRDKPHFETVSGPSLASARRFRFRRKSRPLWERFTLQAQPRSLYMMTGEAPHIWEHSTPAVQPAPLRTMARPECRADRRNSQKPPDARLRGWKQNRRE
jgi:hypothetical protein